MSDNLKDSVSTSAQLAGRVLQFICRWTQTFTGEDMLKSVFPPGTELPAFYRLIKENLTELTE